MKETLALRSGRSLELGMAPFSVGMKLFKVIANELKLVDVDLGSLDLSKIAGKDINTLKNAILQLLGSDALEAAVFACMEKCLLEGQRVTRQTFEPEDMRGDFLPVAWEVIKFNLSPFFSSLGLSSLTPQVEKQAQP